MGRVIAGMTSSLDGFVADAEGKVDRLYADMAELRRAPSLEATIAATGAVLMGRRTFEMGDPDSYVGNYEFQVPIFVLTTHLPTRPPRQDERLTFTFVGDGIAAAVSQAQAAAGTRDVQVVGGASVIQQLLRVSLVDELHLDVMPVLLGGGLRLLENLDPDRVRLETLGVDTVGQRTSLRFRVVH
jgi:dihydrofolate reductase